MELRRPLLVMASMFVMLLAATIATAQILNGDRVYTADDFPAVA